MQSKALKDLFEKGKDQELLDQFAQMETQGKFASLAEDEQIKCLYYRSRSLERLGQFKEALQVATTARTQFKSLKDPILSLMLLIAQLYGLVRLGRLDEALEVSTEGNTVMETLMVNGQQTGTIWVALFENVTGIIYFYKGELDTALGCFQRSLTLREKLGNSSDIVDSLYNIGGIYQAKGELNTALEYHQRSLALVEMIDDLRGLADSLSSIGFIYWHKEEWDRALDHYQRSLTNYETINNPHGITWVLFQIGMVYRHKGELDTALDYWKRSLNLYETLEDDNGTTYSLFGIIILSLELQDHVQAQKHLSQLQKLYERTPNEVSSYLSRLAEALVLKQSKRMKDKVQAQTILQQLINEKILFFAWTRMAMVHLCELLLVEVKSFGDPEVWEEAKTLIQQLYVKAQDYHSFSMIVDALLLQAKIATIDGDLEQALKYYKQARLTAEERKLGLRIQKVDAEQKRFEAEFEKWQDLIQRNVSLQERLAQSQLDDYIQQVQKMVTRMKD